MIFVTAVAGIIVSMVLALIRALLGPTVYDRVLALNINRGANCWS